MYVDLRQGLEESTEQIARTGWLSEAQHETWCQRGEGIAMQREKVQACDGYQQRKTKQESTHRRDGTECQ